LASLSAIGIDVGGTGIKGAIVGSDGSLAARAQVPTDPVAGTKGIIAVAEKLLKKAVSMNERVAAIGVGAAGFVDAASGSVTFSPNLSYDDPQIRRTLSDRFDLPVVVDNDANAAAWGERSFGVAQGLDHIAVITVGTGIGSGFIAEGRLVRGATGAGAEFGHTVIDPGGPQCPCGLKGCLEQLASGLAIGAMARAAVAERPDSSIMSFASSVDDIGAYDVARAARQLDETARVVLKRAGGALAVGLSNIVNIFDPEAIVLAGGVILAGEPFLGPVRDEFSRMTLAQRRRPVRLDVSTLGGDAGIVGAAALALDLVR
jgi:glucokinase